MESIPNFKIFFCYQEGRGGGAFAMKYIISEFAHFNIQVLVNTSAAIYNWKLFSFLRWTLRSIIFWLRQFNNEKNLDWVYTSTFTAGVAASLLKTRLKYKICFHYQVSEIPNNNYVFPSKRYFTQVIKIQILYLLHIFFLKNTNLIIVPSNFSKNELLNNFRMLDQNKIKVIYNGVVNSFLKFSKKRVIRRRQTIISYFGRLEEHKNVQLLIDSFAILSQFKEIKLQIVYVTPNNREERRYKQMLIAHSNKLKLDKDIKWIENPKYLKRFYRISDVVILLSDSEELPLVMMETFANKTLFLSSYVGGVTEVLSKIDKRLLIKKLHPDIISKRIRLLINLEDKQKAKIIEKEYDFVKDLSWENISKNIYQLLIKH